MGKYSSKTYKTFSVSGSVTSAMNGIFFFSLISNKFIYKAGEVWVV